MVLAFGCNKKPHTITLAVVTGLEGTTEPCGCTSKPLGGLDLLAGTLEKTTYQGLTVVGNTFFSSPETPAHLLEQDLAKARTIAKILHKLEPHAIYPGPWDTEQHASTLRSFAAEPALPLFQKPKTPETRYRPDSTLKTWGDTTVAWIGLVGETSLEPDALSASAAAVRSQGADFVIAMLPENTPQARTVASLLKGVDVVITSGHDTPSEPSVVGQTLVLDAGNKGQHVGFLTLHPKPQQRTWVFNDGGLSAKRSLQQRIAQLENTLSSMEDGEGKQARLNKLTGLRKELAQFKAPSEPSTSYVTWKTVPLTHAGPRASWASTLLTAYNKTLCTTASTQLENRTCTKAPTPGEAYVGTATCAQCHPQAYEVYQKTQHAHAWATLEHKGKTCDVGCIGCHSVGFEQPGGFCNLSQGKPFHNVGCENCHGPGAGHVQNPMQHTAGFNAQPQIDTCTTCHNKEHSDQFDFKTYLPRILGPGHGKK